MPVDRRENLIPLNKRTKEEQRRIATNGGIKSGKVRAEKKLLSKIYADVLSSTFSVELEEGKKEKMTGEEYVKTIVKAVLARSDSSAVQMLKEIREATEGAKLELEHSGAIGVTIIDDIR
jgi:hypothetical protein